jgi:ribonuclease BN (tRNA processing enzyme)
MREGFSIIAPIRHARAKDLPAKAANFRNSTLPKRQGHTLTSSAHWIVLGSGSTGNAHLLATQQGTLLLDAGLPLRQIEQRLLRAGTGWGAIRAMVLTHTHTDHWCESVLSLLAERGVVLFCHDGHRRDLQQQSKAFQSLQAADLVCEYQANRAFDPLPGLRCRPLRLSHDSDPTFGFRLEGQTAGRAWAVGYAADLGTWNRELAEALANVDLLALEFNHDVQMQRTSRRPTWLIERVLGNEGHLSNEQGALLLEACLKRSATRQPRHVVQLHLSEECNDPTTARAAAGDVLRAHRLGARLHTATKHGGVPLIALAGS